MNDTTIVSPATSAVNQQRSANSGACATAADLLDHLHRGGTFAYLWRSSDKQSRYFAVGAAIPATASPNVYVGVHPVTRQRPVYERGRIEDVAAINCLFAEFDAKDYGGSKDAIREHLEARAMLWPSVIVDSGGGWHCYWLLDQPHILRNDADRKDAAALQARFVLAIGGDPGAKDLARVLRLPGGLNAKYDPPRAVAIIEAHDVQYTLDELRRWVDYLAPIPPSPATPPRPAATSDQPRGIAGILATVATQGEGNRNSATYWAAKRLREKDIPQSDADVLLAPITHAIGLPEAEARRTVASAYRGAA